MPRPPGTGDRVNEPHHPRARPATAPEAVNSGHGRMYSAAADQYIIEIGEYHANYALHHVAADIR